MVRGLSIRLCEGVDSSMTVLWVLRQYLKFYSLHRDMLSTRRSAPPARGEQAGASNAGTTRYVFLRSTYVAIASPITIHCLAALTLKDFALQSSPADRVLYGLNRQAGFVLEVPSGPLAGQPRCACSCILTHRADCSPFATSVQSCVLLARAFCGGL